MRILPTGIGLSPIDDYHSIVLPKYCKIMQLARYEINEIISVDGDIWDNLNNTNRAALLVHEALYRYLRGIGETTSDNTRLAVGKAFSGIKFESVKDGVPSDAVECIDQPADGKSRWWFTAFKNPQGGVTLQFFMVDGRLMLSKATGPLGPETWPFSATKSSTFAFMSLTSILNGGTPIILSIQRGDNGSIKSFIDVSQNFAVPKTEIFCK
jgi:hypothetical protein